ncbi:hypothetical protein BCR37DRAFT_402797 [Protomyces lactucae-debilis]|uniref:Uncharacterized protein n=1 Tax=Protomyces lactucae-debilis TaxID=2754530 RepID=A0A1Y2FH48_PROLT|nr:uncharacterized protein BCR37DRAFT_402797 [Protomyces lactucae-debilis]ORY82135.1 hypothetical protein BCR37DRAFT_402797 [Protomyces lactucae-debilis]
MADRLAQVGSHLTQLSIVHGGYEPALLEETLGDNLRRTAARHGSRTAVISHWQDKRLTFAQLDHESDVLARSLSQRGVGRGDRVAIFAGNCIEYVVMLYGTAKVGAILVVCNPQYTEHELLRAILGVDVKMLVIALTLGERSFKSHIELLRKELNLPLVLLPKVGQATEGMPVFSDVLEEGRSSSLDVKAIQLDCNDIVNIQFTSGTTSAPKPACLTHRNILNNGRFIGDRMKLTEQDILCVPVPLFHCFGLVLGNLAAFTHATAVVYPTEVFNARSVLECVQKYRCTALHGVPTMFITELELLEKESFDLKSLRTGIAAGTVVNAGIMSRIHKHLHISNLTITYGMTETSPGSFMSSADDPMEKRTTTVGTCMPWTTLKVVDESGKIVPRGTPGEVYVAGYLLQKCYWNDPKATEACLETDENGTVFMKTGDIGLMDNEGYLSIPGRIKDTIIRGGENISPSEVEDQLAAHPSISDVSVVAVHSERYGDVVGAFIKVLPGKPDPTLEDIQNFARERMARYKVPAHIFIMGKEGLADDFPKTGSGKVRKVELRDMANDVVKKRSSL